MSVTKLDHITRVHDVIRHLRERQREREEERRMLAVKLSIAALVALCFLAAVFAELGALSFPLPPPPFLSLSCFFSFAGANKHTCTHTRARTHTLAELSALSFLSLLLCREPLSPCSLFVVCAPSACTHARQPPRRKETTSTNTAGREEKRHRVFFSVRIHSCLH